MNLTPAHHEESRFAGAVFDELTALLTAGGGAGSAVTVRQLHRVPGPVNSEFAVALEVESRGARWTVEFAVVAWKDLADRSPQAQALALAQDVRQLLAAGPPADAVPRRRLFRRR